ncbi:site-2 protease family protein [Mesosutterella sp. AGMB02718]|uniref:Site-2 protease family protein n=1 Tax=Mesosutterella faecium TaxID=2925194 RepID=A0ABT7ILU6_9BURK|nr:site-2 protease family protein [Mesosutterella sp. AGMB02718]MDL2059336.1 site-2 protease family protein [Mesosutterella sp. AGMB02718]
MNINAIVQLITVCAIPLIFAITMHEAAHGYVARRFGDATAWAMGRVTLNPVKHIDPFGTIILPALMLAASAAAGGPGFLFGWAKPVPVNFSALRNPKRDMIWVALAGPLCNLCQAILWGIVLKLLLVAGVQEEFFLRMAVWGVNINIFLMAFNLIPIPPLDGGRVAVGVLPWSIGRYIDRLEPYGMWIVIALCFIGGASFLVEPLVRIGQAVVSLFAGI